MAKFAIGDRIRQIEGGWGTSDEDNGKEAIIAAMGVYFLATSDTATIIKTEIIILITICIIFYLACKIW